MSENTSQMQPLLQQGKSQVERELETMVNAAPLRSPDQGLEQGVRKLLEAYKAAAIGNPAALENLNLLIGDVKDAVENPLSYFTLMLSKMSDMESELEHYKMAVANFSAFQQDLLAKVEDLEASLAVVKN